MILEYIKEIEKIRSSFLFCDNCNHELKYSTQVLYDYFKSNLKCCSCNEKIDLFKIFEKKLDNDMFGDHYSLVNCKTNSKTFSLQSNQFHILTLSDEIKDGELLYINYTPYTSDGTNILNSVFPLEMHSNTPQYHIRNNDIHLLGYSMIDIIKSMVNGGGQIDSGLEYSEIKSEMPVETNINALYWYVPEKNKKDIKTMLLIDAFKHFYEENYRYCIMSAFTAIEISQTNFFNRIFKSKDNSNNENKNIESFFKENATFSKQIKILLPFLAKNFNFSMINSKIRDGVLSIKSYRDEIVHSGETKESLKKDNLKNKLISAILICEYYEFILDYLNK